MSDYEIALVGIGGTLAGTLLGSLVGYWLSIKLNKIGLKQQSAYRLHVAFRDELLMLNTQESVINGSLCEYLKNAFEKHRLAVYEYSFYLEHSVRSKFIKAWEVYYLHDNYEAHGCTLRHLEKYSTAGLSHDEKLSVFKLAESRIAKILAFATIS